MVYWLLLYGIITLSPICKKIYVTNKNNTDKSFVIGKNLYIQLVSFILILLSGGRALSIGRDTMMYEEIFYRIQNYSDLKAAIEYSSIEMGYVALNYYIGKVFDYRIFLVIVAIATIIPVMFIIRKYSKNIPLSIFVFICFGYFTFSMSGIRQALAISCVMMAYHYMRECSLKKFIFFVAVGTSFHMTSILFLPIYWIDKIKFNMKVIGLIAVAIVTSYVTRNQIFDFISLYARQQYDVYEAGGQKMYLFILLSVILGIWYRNKYKEQEENVKTLLYMQVLTVIIWPVASINPAIFRLYYYYHIFSILFIPELISSIPNKIEKLIVGTGFVIIGLYYLISQILPEAQGYNPYLFFWQ